MNKNMTKKTVFFLSKLLSPYLRNPQNPHAIASAKRHNGQAVTCQVAIFYEAAKTLKYHLINSRSTI